MNLIFDLIGNLVNGLVWGIILLIVSILLLPENIFRKVLRKLKPDLVSKNAFMSRLRLVFDYLFNNKEIMQREWSERTEETGQDDRVRMDVEGAAEYLGVKCSWVYDRTRKKEIPHVRVGKYLRFRKSAIDDWLTQKRTAFAFDTANSRLKGMDRKTKG